MCISVLLVLIVYKHSEPGCNSTNGTQWTKQSSLRGENANVRQVYMETTALTLPFFLIVTQFHGKSGSKMNNSNYYVYVYYDPVDFTPFYVGKGTGGRKYKHLHETEETTENVRKYNKIQKILSSGLKPLISIFRSDLTEDEAYEIEANLIKQWGRKGYDDGGVLTNVCVDARPPGMKGKNHSSKTKKRIQQKMKSWIKEHGNPMQGRSHSDESKQLMSERKKELGTTITPTGRRKVGVASSKRNKGAGNPNYGRTRKAMYNPATKECRYIDTTEGLQQVQSLLSAGWLFGLLRKN